MFTTFFRSDSNTSTRLNLVALLLRLSLGVIFIYHGLEKITAEGSGGASWVSQMYGEKHEVTGSEMRDGRLQVPAIPTTLTFTGTQLAVAWGEFIGGLTLLVGLLTRLAAVGLIIIQIGAIILVTAPRGFSLEKGGGYEYNLALLAMCLSLVILGAGKWSVDWIETPKRRRLAAQVAAETPAPPPAVAEPPAARTGQPAEHATPAM